MSYDLAIWKSGRPLTPLDALDTYHRLCEDDVPADVGPCQEMKAFTADLLKRWPYDAKHPDDCPFEDPGGSEVFMILHFAASRADELVPQLVALAGKHGLVCFDPQNGTVRPRRPWWQFWG